MQNQTYETAFEYRAAEAAARTAFLKKTYINLALAFLAFIALEAALMQWQPAVELAGKMVSGGNWMMVLLAFMGVSWLANSWALSPASIGKQYAGLYLYIAAEAVIFLPLLLLAEAVAPDAIFQAAALTASLAGGITAVAFLSGKSFSYLRSFVVIGSFVALGFIFCSMIFGFQLGLWFAFAMAIFASVAVLYQTGEVIHNYGNNQYVAAALGLFAAIALLFWYILQILMSSRR